MYRQKTLLFAAVILAIYGPATASVSNADLILTLNGLDAAKELVEIKGKNNLVIAIAGQSDANAQDVSIACDNGKLEPLTEPGKYLFTVTDKSDVCTVSLNVGKEVFYRLVLFYIPESNSVIVFCVDREALAPAQPKTEPEPQPEQQISASQITKSGRSYFAGMSGGRTTEIDGFPEPNSYPNINGDDIVNFADFAMFAENWQKSGSGLDGDFDNSGTVETNDLETLAYFWLNGRHPLNVFESFKTALLADDVNEAVSYFAEVSAENYRPLLEQLRPYFTQMVNDMGELVFIKFDTDMVMYDLLREEDGRTYGYPVVFVRDEMGQWKIYDF